MGISWKSEDKKDDTNIANDLNQEKKRGAISIKMIFMIIMIIVIILILITKGVFALKNSFFGNKNNNEQQIEMVLVDSKKINIPNQVTNPDNLPDEVNIGSYNDGAQEKPVIFKGKLGLASQTNNNIESQNQPNKAVFNEQDESKTTSNVIKAEISKLDPNLSIFKGTFIKCSLRTDLITQVSGGVGCIINDDIYSGNGNTLLIEKGSIVNGAFRRVSVNQGDNRIFVLWEEIRTPHNLIINVNSGASDVLGAQGINGYVDNHFWTRFGNAILVSMISDLSSAGASRLQKENTNYDFNNTTDSGANIAKSIIEKNVDIPPTIYRNHGDSVGIYTNQDIDFSNVYKLEYRK